MFLTTNRVGAFDDAFISRIHVQLFYPEFTDEQRQLVWKTFMDKLARERGDYIRLNIDAKEYIRGTEMRSVQWNGREIRNGKLRLITTQLIAGADVTQPLQLFRRPLLSLSTMLSRMRRARLSSQTPT